MQQIHINKVNNARKIEYDYKLFNNSKNGRFKIK